MTPQRLSKTGVGRSSVAAVDNFTNPFNVGIGAVVTGVATFNIEYSFSDPMDAGYDPAAVAWFVAPAFSAATASVGGALVIPCKAICINVTSGAGTVAIEFIQSVSV